jgi:hypothetical protein
MMIHPERNGQTPHKEKMGLTGAVYFEFCFDQKKAAATS